MSNSTKPRVDDEDDVDDLDDVLDQFTPAKAPASSLSQPSTSSPAVNEPTSSKQEPSSSNADFEADFAKSLAEDMEALWRDLAQQGLMSTEGMDGSTDPSLAQGAPITPKTGEKDDFQSRIRNTMNKLKESESGLKSSDPSSSAPSADPLEALLSQLGDEDEEEMQGVLEAMMGQLMGKDVLYEPLKELSDKFPGYLKANATTLTSDDKSRYDAQIICIMQLLEIFESKDYADDDDKTRIKIVELMGELQKHGSPPEEIMGPLPPGLNMGADGMPDMPDNCIIS
ncbi:Pex19 protein family-domain-containing protein [Suillus fuscotomentosus]|uniref:Pex19 protein family-domain-containing protein n=1 Tax=Suillus fuscotomentosus TaxID=1912939 RepID=A0AAD4HKW9_9AGAM|nr:Pex19 protein family-domain-containing protein [Suillus fuscotomentosus]KAG1899936.1 Pex19 protein family-domain-containing protein [Suillus fuscotomentosus]